MKIITAQEMGRIEKMAYDDGAKEKTFMKNAGTGVAQEVQQYVFDGHLKKNVTIVCGKGNNAGDAYVAAIIFKRKKYAVKVLQLFPIEECSPLLKENYHGFIKEKGHVTFVEDVSDITFDDETVIIDGILGTGFHGNVEGFLDAVITKINNSKLPVIAIDMPSGLNGTTGEAGDTAIRATKTISLGLPKTGFFISNGWDCVGKLQHVDFGLEQKYIEEADSTLSMLVEDDMKPLMPEIIPSRNKYQAGYVVGIAGSPGMAGAAMLAGEASLRGGAGITRVFHPKGMEAEMAEAPYELITQSYTNNDINTVAEALNKASAVFVGPGIGKQPATKEFLKEIIREIKKPCVFDADALNIIAEDNTIQIPKGAILTPHVGEMCRLLGKENTKTIDEDFLEQCQKYSDDKNITVILKGGPTFIFHPETTPVVNTFGDPGMATAGSGDALTGLVAALLAQKLKPYDAARLAVYLHSYAGECAAQDLTSYCMTASDIIEYFPEAFSIA
ncbi:MAG: NAD(P)H-hydrate dehydratase [Waddliaceae bacterium]|jgi:ADP-dependent NAD(P)H-hydrate dehydratase / NAD(P)H-hydrate epimerase|nr:NAD(P)H-hydrate dehydratase [Waddliaceae bacterium]MBT3579160.1 NAD(P)H-hydrate dehydratase [Waddliaceae bacterium]MBT4444316.1 NAD(P)H-hydrate dehydratase [Waddliaceae bacterium]MBT6928531.1 NAD(P)H-hydrate dehydratase [Waddliaceae bacterium]MBT7264869.1 NAD(P)H-hydrate dehydratase [Waddliaceae bacterium]